MNSGWAYAIRLDIVGTTQILNLPIWAWSYKLLNQFFQPIQLQKWPTASSCTSVLSSPTSIVRANYHFTLLFFSFFQNIFFIFLYFRLYNSEYNYLYFGLYNLKYNLFFISDYIIWNKKIYILRLYNLK